MPPKCPLKSWHIEILSRMTWPQVLVGELGGTLVPELFYLVGQEKEYTIYALIGSSSPDLKEKSRRWKKCSLTNRWECLFLYLSWLRSRRFGLVKLESREL